MMESVNRLRKYVKANTDESYVLTSYPPQHRVVCSTMINDLIDAIGREVDEEYVALPKDADGEYINIGDEIEYGKVRRIEIADDGDHKVYFSTRPDNPHLDWRLCKYVHHKQPSVEDVLREFAKSIAEVLGGNEFLLRDDDEMYAEFAERLQLRGEEQA